MIAWIGIFVVLVLVILSVALALKLREANARAAEKERQLVVMGTADRTLIIEQADEVASISENHGFKLFDVERGEVVALCHWRSGILIARSPASGLQLEVRQR